MTAAFKEDPYPGGPKILFIGLAHSTHTHGWIDLLNDAEFNVRLFAIPVLSGFSPGNWKVRTYVSNLRVGKNTATRQYIDAGLDGRLRRYYNRVAVKMGRPILDSDSWLASVIKKWKPDIIHTLGFFDGQGGEFYLAARQKFRLENYGRWVIQLRGGSDLALRRHNPKVCPTIQLALSTCDQIISDNRINIRYASELGISSDKFASIVPVPGSGGIELPNEAELNPPSKRERMILCPKVYEGRWSKSLPVLDAIQSVWKKIGPCEIYLLAMPSDVYEWYLSMPVEIRKHCHVTKRLSRQDVLVLMQRARVLLAPSLIDGIPNSLYEAMAYGAFPIVSPLETIASVVNQEENVLFARNLYPLEIADALSRAMNDDALVDQAAKNNFQLVRKVADRKTIKAKVVDYYQKLAADI